MSSVVLGLYTCTTLDFYKIDRDLTSSHPACVANALLSEPSFQPKILDLTSTKCLSLYQIKVRVIGVVLDIWGVKRLFSLLE